MPGDVDAEIERGVAKIRAANQKDIDVGEVDNRMVSVSQKGPKGQRPWGSYGRRQGASEWRLSTRAKIRYGLALAGITAATKKTLGGRLASPRNGGPRPYAASGMSREATLELCGWKSSEVVEGVYNKVRSKDVVQETRADL